MMLKQEKVGQWGHTMLNDLHCLIDQINIKKKTIFEASKSIKAKIGTHMT